MKRWAWLLAVTAGAGASSHRAGQQDARRAEATVAATAPAAGGADVSFAALSDDVFDTVATAFLTGADRHCHATGLPWECQHWPFLRPPAASRVRRLHRDTNVADYRPYYYDPLDLDPKHGLEEATVVLYAGHGTPIDWTSYGYGPTPTPRRACLADVHLGDGLARYLFMLSCNVMAHGPQVCPPRAGKAVSRFGCPERLSPSLMVQSAPVTCDAPGETQSLGRAQNNVFERWRDHLSPRMRLACGGSTELFTWDAPARFWEAYAVQHLPVADALILSLLDEDYVPLCLTEGNGRPEATPLYDTAFEPGENLASPGSYMFAMFPVRDVPPAEVAAASLRALAGAADDPAAVEDPIEDDWIPPVLEVTRPQLPPWLEQFADATTPAAGAFGFKDVPKAQLPGFTGKDPASAPEVRVQPRSGAVQIRWAPAAAAGHPHTVALAPALGTRIAALELAPADFLAGGGGSFAADATARGIALQIDRVDRSNPATAEPDHFVKCGYGRLQQRVKVAGRRIDPGSDGAIVSHVLPVLGAGSDWMLQLCPSGQGTTAGISGASLQLAGRDEMGLFLAGRHVTGQQPIPPRADGSPRTLSDALAVAWTKVADQLGEPVAAAKSKLAAPEVARAYLAAPAHCRQSHLYPIYRFTFHRSVGDPPQQVDPLGVDVSVYGPGMAFATEEWVCDPPSP
jgi:hypothetical protein